MNRVELLPKLQGETASRYADFISKLQSSETISSCSVTASVYSGNDSNPSGILNGSATISGTQVWQSLTAGVAGCVYELLFKAVTSLSNTYELSGYLAVTPDLP